MFAAVIVSNAVIGIVQEPERPNGEIGTRLTLGHPLHRDVAVGGLGADDPAPGEEAAEGDADGEDGSAQEQAIEASHAKGSEDEGY